MGSISNGIVYNRNKEINGTNINYLFMEHGTIIVYIYWCKYLYKGYIA